MYTLTSFKRKIATQGQQVEVELRNGQVRWVGAQEHYGENIGDTESHAIFVELKESRASSPPPAEHTLGPSS